MDANIPPEVLAEMQAVMEALASGRRVDEETYRRIRERGERVRDEVRRKFGEVDLAVDLVREIREE
jgi:hypothetical protein